MKKCLLLLVLAIFSIYMASQAQTKSKKFDITFGEEYKAAKRSTLDDIIGYDESGMYALKKTFKGRRHLPPSLSTQCKTGGRPQSFLL